MQIKIFNIPIGAEEAQTEELNHFLRSNKIIDIKKEVVWVENNNCWSFCITYMQSNSPDVNNTTRPIGGTKVDYKEILSSEVFERFSQFRKLRKQIADDEAIPAYAVFTDAELAEMAKLNPISLDAMNRISGIGKKKMEKYGDKFLHFVLTLTDEAGRAFDRTDSRS